ncbi:hypothetical protein TeGR_g8159 [Tetraparma gracilis]|uniref:Thioredoxin domain-containing protein n=1 Tax=Tetraparma gracilis TaxID=2962635 RepID=A0ABQ6NCH8_9STRA|nr:hypothetical protein TeGR_g8159 [Tetraparma gracilis]
MKRSLALSRRNSLAVFSSGLLASLGSYLYSYRTASSSPLATLATLTKASDLRQIYNGKPSVVEIWAPWCDNCLAAAPSLSALHAEFSSDVNFVLVNGDDPGNGELVARFRADAIPHLALLSGSGSAPEVLTTLVGQVPESVVRGDLRDLVESGGKRVGAEMMDLWPEGGGGRVVSEFKDWGGG